MSLRKLHGGSSSSSATACAACKYQRKKCTKSCILAPYFPQECPKQFLNAHKLFGVSNITKMIKGVEECQRQTAMENLIFHANARALDPVGGVFKIMTDLKHKIDCLQAELNFLYRQLAICRSVTQQQDLSFGCSYGDLLGQPEQAEGYEQSFQQMQQQSPLNYEKYLEMPEQSSKVKLEKEGISGPGQSQILMPSQII